MVAARRVRLDRLLRRAQVSAALHAATGPFTVTGPDDVPIWPPGAHASAGPGRYREINVIYPPAATLTEADDRTALAERALAGTARLVPADTAAMGIVGDPSGEPAG